MRNVPAYGLLLLTLAVTLPAAAQVTGNLKMGVTAMTITGEAALDFEARVGWGGGAAVGYDFGNGLQLLGEALYIVKGATAQTNAAVLSELRDLPPAAGAEDVAVALTWNLTYVELPLLAVYRFDVPLRVQPKVFAGPSLAYKLSSRVHFESESAGGTRFSEEDESVQQTDFGAVVGGGVEFAFGTERLTVDLRALLGRANIRKREPALRNTGVGLFVGLVF